MGQEEFENTVFILKDKLFRFARKILNDAQDAEDVVQEVMLGFWNKRHEISKLVNFEAYAMRSVKNMSLDKIKHYKVRKDKMTDIIYHTESIYTEHSAERNEMQEIIKNSIDSLPEKQKLIIHLRDIEGYSFEEMSEVLEMDEVALRVNLSRARKKVKDEILKIINYGIK